MILRLLKTNFTLEVPRTNSFHLIGRTNAQT